MYPILCLYSEMTLCYWVKNVLLTSKSIQDTLKRKVAKPYSPIVDAANAEAIPKYTFDLMSPQQMPSSGVLSSTFGSGAN